MNGGAHMLIGAAAAAALNYYHPYLPPGWLPLGVGISAAVAGALLPDLDHPSSTLSHKLGVARGDGPLGCAGFIGGVFRNLLGGHRGLTHTLLAVGLLALAVGRVLPSAWQPYGLAALIGYGSHLVADLGHGVPLLWPLTTRHIGLWR